MCNTYHDSCCSLGLERARLETQERLKAVQEQQGTAGTGQQFMDKLFTIQGLLRELDVTKE